VTGEYRKKVRGDFMRGVRSDVNGTPTFFINGMRHDGAFDYATLVWAIQIRLAAAQDFRKNRSAQLEAPKKGCSRIDNGQCCFAVCGLFPQLSSKPQERAMVAFSGFRTPPKPGIDATSALPGPHGMGSRSPDWIIWMAPAVALAIFLATGAALPQAGVQLVKVDLSVVAKGYRMSKLIGSGVINDKNEKIGTVDDVVADKDKKQLNFAVLQVGGFLGLGGRLVAVPYDSLVIDDAGQKITLPGATKDELKKLSEFNYPA
jgi:sporulation protein YlmC with PRC-barrel domain